MQKGLSGLGQCWAVLSLAAAVLCCSGFYLPYWIKGRLPGDVDAFFGSYRRCNYPKLTAHNTFVIVHTCASYSRWRDIPSGWWKGSTALVGAGSAVSLVVSVLCLAALCLSDVLTPATARLAGTLQLLAGLLVGGGCALYPMGWSVDEVRDACGQSSSQYRLGSCEVWWSAVWLVSGMATLFLCCLTSLCCRVMLP